MIFISDVVKSILYWIMVAVVAFIVIMIFIGLAATSGTSQIDEIEDQVAEDAQRQYEMTVESGSPIDRCVQAGMVVAAFLQAENAEEYARWKDIEDEDCQAAGLFW